MNKFNGTPDWAIGRGRAGVRAVVPANGLLDLRAYDGKVVHVNTTGTVTQIIPPPNGECVVVFDAVCTLTHGANTLILPGATNITTAVNDVMQVVDEDNRAARVAYYSKANGQPLITPSQNKISTATLTKTSDTTLADIPGLVVTLVAGVSYAFNAELIGSWVNGGGVKVGFAGTATATSFLCSLSAGLTGGGYGETSVTSLASTLGSVQQQGAVLSLNGTFNCNVGGTFQLQFAQNTSLATPSIVLVNSPFLVDRVN